MSFRTFLAYLCSQTLPQLQLSSRRLERRRPTSCMPRAGMKRRLPSPVRPAISAIS